MKTLSVFAVICAFTCGTNMAAAADTLVPVPVGHAIQERIASGEYPSVVIAIVDGNHAAVYGYGDAGPGKKADGDTVYEIGSITKTFTATLLADAVAHGSAVLDRDASSLAEGLHLPTSNGKAISLANLAEQNSGLPRLPDNFAPSNPSDPYADYDASRLRAFLNHYDLPRAPGSQYEYSNLAVGTLGYLLSAHAGSTYAELVMRKIFTPLGMDHTSVAIGLRDPDDMAIGHDFSGRPVPTWHFDALAPAGGIRSTGNDMLRYLRANMGAPATPLSSVMHDAQRPRADTDLPGTRIGLVWMTRHDGKGADVIWHGGMTGGFASFIGFTSDYQHGVVILTNSAVKVDDLGFTALRADLPLAPAHGRAALTEEQLAGYQGAFRLSKSMVLRISAAKDQLFAQATGQRPIPIYPSGGDAFFTQADDIAMDFKRGNDGKVSGLVLHRHGDHDAPKITDAEAASVEHIEAATLDAATLQSYVGRYSIDGGRAVLVTMDGAQLKAQIAGQPAVPIYARARDHFFLTIVNAQIDFERDAKGSIDGFVLHQAGRDHHASRIRD